MKRATKSWIAAALAMVLTVPAATVWWMTRPTSVYTDADSIRRPVAVESPRDILWQPPRPLSEAINAPLDVYEPKLSWDGLTLYFVRGKAGENADLFAAQRTASGWTEPRAITSINTEHEELGPEPAADGSAIYFYSNRPGSMGGYDLWVARKRADASPGAVDMWQEPTNLGPAVNSEYNDYGPALARDGKTLFFSSNRPGRDDKQPADPLAWRATLREDLHRRTYDLYSCQIVDDAPQRATPLDALNTPQNEGAPCISPAGDFLYFASDRAGGLGGFDLYRVRRLGEQFASPQNLGPSVNTPASELDPGLAQLGFALYFSSNRAERPTAAAASQPSPDRKGAGTETHDAESTRSLTVGARLGESVRPEREPARYAVYYTTSREVFLDSDARPIDWAGLWARLWPNLLWLLLGLLALLLLLLLYRDLRDRRLSLLARCLIASVALHCALMALLGVWRVSTAIGEFVRGGGKIQITLAAAGVADSLAVQIRGNATDALKVESESPETPRADISQPQPEVSAVRVETPPTVIESSPIAQEAAREARPAEMQRAESVSVDTKHATITPRVESEQKPADSQAEPTLHTPTQVTTAELRPTAPTDMAVAAMRVDVAPTQYSHSQAEPISVPGDARESQPDAPKVTNALTPVALSRTTTTFDKLPTPNGDAETVAAPAEPVSHVNAAATATSRPAFATNDKTAVEPANIQPAATVIFDFSTFDSNQSLPDAQESRAVPTSSSVQTPVALSRSTPSALNIGLPPAEQTPRDASEVANTGDFAKSPQVSAMSTQSRAAPLGRLEVAAPSMIRLDAGASGGARRADVALAAEFIGEDARPQRPGTVATSPLTVPLASTASALNVALPIEPDAEDAKPDGAAMAVGTLRGTVRDKSSGKPLAGATVRVDLAGSEPVTATTNDKGEYTLSLPQTPDYFAVAATAENYEPAARNMPGEALAREGLVGDFELEPETEMVIAVEDEPQVHHLGNDAFEGAINSQFQRHSEGAALIGEFTLRDSQTPPGVEQAEVKMLIKGAQCPHQVIINGRMLRAKIEQSPSDGSFGEQVLALDPRLLRQGANTIEVRAVSCRGDLDDFEFVNVQIRLRRRANRE